MAKREGYLCWDDYFMSVALLSGKRSKDPNTQVGACIVNKNNVIESIGYNGLPKGCSDDEFPWEKEGEMLNTKYPFVLHCDNLSWNYARALGDRESFIGEENTSNDCNFFHHSYSPDCSRLYFYACR